MTLHDRYRQMLRRLVEKRSFGVTSMVELLQRGAPSVVQSQVDAKLRLERQLKQVRYTLLRALHTVTGA